MKIYTVHLRHNGLDGDRDLILVAEGFNWAALVFGPFWALFKKLWWVALGLVLLNLGIGLAGKAFIADPQVQLAVSLGVASIVGFLANDLRRWTLERAGFIEIGVVSAPDADAAFQRYLDAQPELARAIG
jgi:hypothetical protein